MATPKLPKGTAGDRFPLLLGIRPKREGRITTTESKLNPGFADRLITVLIQADMRPQDLATRIGVPLEVVEACLKGKVPEAEALYRMAKGLDATME